MTRRELLASFVVLGSAFDVQNAERPASNDERRTLRVGVLRADSYSVSTMPIEKYVSGVLAGEAVRGSAPAALEALAIAIRTFAIANLGRHRADGFDLCDQTHCQVLRSASAATDRAAQATAGRLLVDRAHAGAPASIFFSASCGGHTEKPSDVWPGAEDPPYLPSRADEACGGVPAWTADIYDTDLVRSLRAVGFRGDRLDDVRIGSRTSSGRVARLRLEGMQPAEISGQDLRVAVGRTLGWQFVKSTVFTIERRGDTTRFSGHGSGHGVGLCVIGSAKLAEQGKSVEEILRQYFPGLAVAGSGAVRTPTGSSSAATSIYLPPEDEGEHTALVREIERASREMAQALAVTPPGGMVVRFHPTTTAYERATGASKFASVAVVNGEVHLLPLAVLRERGLLERTIRRGVVHVIVDPVLRSRPVWVREGAALYFSAPDGRSGVRGPCPEDGELTRPVSAGALSNAYVRARECFARQIDAGRSWRDVR